MKKLFKAIRDANLDAVKEIIENKPELVNCVAKQPPKRMTDNLRCRWLSRREILI